MKALSHTSAIGKTLTDLHQQAASALVAASRDALAESDVTLTPAPSHTGSDFSFPCFPLAKAWRMNPAQIAGQMAEALATDGWLQEAEAAGPYLNLKLDRQRVAAALFAEVASTEGYGSSMLQDGESVMVEYVSPNTNKPLHLGHVRNAVIGRAVANLVASQAAKVLKTDIINDRGIHIAKSMLAYQRWGDGQTPESAGVKGDHFVGSFYVVFEQHLSAEQKAWRDGEGAQYDDSDGKDAQAAFLEQSELMQAARQLLQRWEAGDSEVRELWRKMNTWVYAGFDESYRRLGVDFDKHYYESDIYGGGKETILDALERGVFEKAENGAVVAPLSKHGKLQDKVVLRADGTGLYITQDINLATIKFAEFGLTRSLYCIASEQAFYMKQLIATLELLGFEWAKGMHHLSYGMVYLPDGKMKSREGKVVDADELMRGMAELAREELVSRHTKLEGQALEDRAFAIGLAAITFDLLKVGKDTDIHFNPEASVSFKGRTGPYLQYTYARISSVLRKAEGTWQMPDEPSITVDNEWHLVLGALLFPTVVADAAETYDPSRLLGFLSDQAQSFNTYYHDHRVLDSPEPQRSTRLALLATLRVVLGNGLRLIGIEPLEEM